MKLLTHNMLTTKFIKGVVNGYPVHLTASEVKITPVDFNGGFVRRILQRVNYEVLRNAASEIGKSDDLPVEIPQNITDDDLLKKIHHVLLEIDVINGELICPESGRKFTITNGIPNMFEHECESEMQVDET